MKSLPLLSPLLLATLFLTRPSRGDETAGTPLPGIDNLVSVLENSDPERAGGRVVRDAGGKVVELTLSPRFLTPELLGQLRYARDLETLSVGCCTLHIGEDLAVALGGTRKLTTLRMFGCGADALPRLQPNALGKLRTLSISYQSVTAEIATAVAGLPALEELQLHSAHGLTAAALGPLAACPKLKSADFSSTDAGDDLVELLVGLKGTLKAVNLCNTKFSGVGLQRLREAGLAVRIR